MAKLTNTERIAKLERSMRTLQKKMKSLEKELEDFRQRDIDVIGFEVDFDDPDDFDPDESEYRRG